MARAERTILARRRIKQKKFQHFIYYHLKVGLILTGAKSIHFENIPVDRVCLANS